MTEPHWMGLEELLILHAESLAKFGGAEGLCGAGLLESALARPKSIFNDATSDIIALAAAHAFAIAKNHPFVDGDKRPAFLACGLFLERNSWRLEADPDIAAAAMLDLAAGDLDEAGLARWLRDGSKQP